MSTIYHITTQSAWQAALSAGQYTADSLVSQGFIHCSTAEQVVATANRYYAGQPGLVLLRIAEEKLGAEVRYENLEGGAALFPHIYGPLNLAAVSGTALLPPGPDGQFTFPASWSA